MAQNTSGGIGYPGRWQYGLVCAAGDIGGLWGLERDMGRTGLAAAGTAGLRAGVRGETLRGCPPEIPLAAGAGTHKLSLSRGRRE